MKDIIKYPENSVDYIKLMEKYFVTLEKKKKIQRAKILVSEELNKIGWCFYKIELVFGKKINVY